MEPSRNRNVADIGRLARLNRIYILSGGETLHISMDGREGVPGDGNAPEDCFGPRAGHGSEMRL
jgi:hypothetical protein